MQFADGKHEDNLGDDRVRAPGGAHSTGQPRRAVVPEKEQGDPNGWQEVVGVMWQRINCSSRVVHLV